jgi:hypothetical protein
MKIVHLIQYHLGGGRKRKDGKGGHTPTPKLPDAGKPYVDSVSYDKDAKKVRLRAQNARAGEVKTPLGEWQEFPIDVPTPTPLPDAGKPFVEGVTYDPDTKKVKVRAKVAQAGEVKDPDGELEYFDVEIPEKYIGIVHKYNVKNATGRTTLKYTAGSGDAPVVNGASVPLSIVLNAGQEGVVYSPVGKFELNTPLQNGELVAVYNNYSNSNVRRMFFFADKVTLSRTTEGYLLVERSVISED